MSQAGFGAPLSSVSRTGIFSGPYSAQSCLEWLSRSSSLLLKREEVKMQPPGHQEVGRKDKVTEDSTFRDFSF